LRSARKSFPKQINSRARLQEGFGVIEHMRGIISYGGQIQRKYKKDILDTANANLVESLQHKQAAGPPAGSPSKIYMLDGGLIHFIFCKNVRTLALKIGIP
jgi:hypothetical protein